MKKTVSAEDSRNEFDMRDLKVILLGGKRWMISVGLIAAVAMWMSWDLLVSIGAASVIFAIAPCLIMCSLGLCMNKSGCHKKQAPDDTDA